MKPTLYIAIAIVLLAAASVFLTETNEAIGAVSATNLATTGDNVDRTTYTTASITPAADNLILAWVWAIGADVPPEPTLTGNSLTWVQVETEIVGARRLTLFRAMGSSPSAGTVSIDFAGDTQTGCIWSIVQYDGADTSGTNGSGAIVQAVATSSTTNVGSFTVPLSAFASADNGTAAGFGIPLNQAGLPDPGGGFTETGQRNQGSPNLAFMSEFRADNDTSADATWTGFSVPVAAIAVEIKHATAEVVVSDDGAMIF